MIKIICNCGHALLESARLSGKFSNAVIYP